MNETSLTTPRHWVEFQDPHDSNQMYRCDLTWLTSKWECIFGRGCKGILKDRPDDGCCSHGAHFTDAKDAKHVKKFVELMTEEDWQFKSVGDAGGWSEKEDGQSKTRVHQDGCIFLNRPGFAAGSGCAFHVLGNRIGERPMDMKPDVCWQLPMRRDFETREFEDDTEQSIVIITEFDRRSWGPGGHDFDWYCSSNPEAHTAAEHVYVTEKGTLIKLMSAEAYDILLEHCIAHEKAVETVQDSKGRKLIPLHPATAVRAKS